MTEKIMIKEIKIRGARVLKFSAMALLILGSCSAPKDVAYFQDTVETVIPITSPRQIKIEPNDKLSIIVKSMDPALSSMFNLTINSERVGASTEALAGSGTGTLRTSGSGSEGLSKYTVTPEGYIDFPVLGNLYVQGMTKNELAAFIKGELMGRNLVKDPVVTVEFVNFGVSVMGEVARPGRYDITQDQINVLEAISMAGDLTIQGKRENVAVLREEADGLHTYRIDLTNFQEVAKSPAYYLKQGDIIYVEPNNVKKRQTTANGNNLLSTGFWISVASLLTSVVTTIAVFVR